MKKLKIDKKVLLAAAIAFLVIIVVIVGLVLAFKPKPNVSNKAVKQPDLSNVFKNINLNNAVGENAVLPQETFANGLGSWYEESWYAKKDSGGEVITGDNGLTFRGVQDDSRSGVMLDLNRDVSGFQKLNLQAVVQADIQTLQGTGWQGREAPVAIAVAYQAVDGSEHKTLSEDPTAAGQMYWHGFYYLDPMDGKSVNTNGTRVPQGRPFTFNFDLMSLNPKPKMIYFVALEGAGWKDREGKVSSISIAGEK